MFYKFLLKIWFYKLAQSRALCARSDTVEVFLKLEH